MGYRGETMWSWRGSQCWTRLAALAAAFAWGIGSAAAVESSAPSLRVSGRASFSTEAHADIDTYEVGATLSDEVGHPLPAAEILICHCPPLGINDDPEDPAHVGFEGLRAWVDRHRPRHLLHGHVHPVAGLAATRYGDTRVHWVSGARVLQLD